MRVAAGLILIVAFAAFYFRVPLEPVAAKVAPTPAPLVLAPPSTPRATAAVAQPVALADRALDQSATGEERLAALFDLTTRRPADVDAIARIAAEPYDIENPRAPFEIRVRIHAIEALDRLGAEGSDVQNALVAVANADPDENLKMFVTIALAGLEQGRPGKLNRFLTEILNQEIHE